MHFGTNETWRPVLHTVFTIFFFIVLVVVCNLYLKSLGAQWSYYIFFFINFGSNMLKSACVDVIPSSISANNNFNRKLRIRH